MSGLARLFAILAIIIFYHNPCQGAAPALEAFNGQEGKITITGGTAPIPLMKGAARNIMTYNPKVRITVAGGGSGAGIEKVGKGEAQISNSGRPLKEAEIQKYGLVSFPYAIDGVAVAVNPRNPVSDLSKEELKGIFSGKITNWKEVGGMDMPISVYSRDSGSGARDTFEEKALGANSETQIGKELNSNDAMKSAIGRDMNSIGYITIGHLDDSIKGVKIDGVAPSQDGAASGAYKVTRFLYMNTKGQPKGIVKNFIDFIYSPSGAELIRKSGYIPYSPQNDEKK